MAWISELFLAVTAVLALAALWPGRQSRWTPADRWLVQHYYLTSLGACHEVRERATPIGISIRRCLLSQVPLQY
jgi:hypothetical protein